MIFFLMSSCFFSSRLKILISEKDESMNLFNTALPNEPVPPVINNVLSLNLSINGFYQVIEVIKKLNVNIFRECFREVRMF